MPERKTIWYVHPYAGGPGIGRYDRPFHLSRAWNAVGHRSVVIAPAFHHLLDTPRAPGSESVQGVSYEFVEAPVYAGNGLGRLKNMALFSWRLARMYPQLVERHGAPSMVVASSPHPYVFAATHRIARRSGALSVFEVRDLWPLSLVELANVSPMHPLVVATGWLETFAYRNADCVVSLLPNTLPHMQTRGLSPQRWRYIPNGVGADVTPSGETHDVVRTALALKAAGRFVLVYTGAIGPPNNVEALVRAVDLLRNESVPLSVMIVGRGESQGRVVDLVRSLNLDGMISLFPQVPKAAVQALLKVADAGFLSLRPEPLFRFGVSPNKLFDYMQAGLPVVFAISAGNDPVGEAGCGFSVNPAAIGSVAGAIRQMALLLPEERKAMGRRGEEYVIRKHSYERLAADYASLLEPGRNAAF